MGAKWISKVVLVIVICSLSGCGILKEPFEESIYAFFENETTFLIEKKEISKDFCAIIDNLSSMYLSYDENEKLYIRALDTVNEYLEGKLSQEEALKELEKIYSRCKNITFYLEGEKMAFAMSKGIEIERGRGYFNLGLQ